MTDVAERALASANTIAVVGLSRNPDRAAHAVPASLQAAGFRIIPVHPAHAVPASLQAAGFRIIPVHPSANVLLGEKVYRSLADIPEPVDLVDVFRPAREAPGIAREAVSIGAKTLWLQQGIVSAEARSIAEQAG